MGLTSEQEHRLDSDPTRHAHVARTVFRLRDVFDRLMKPTEQPRLVLSTQYTRCGALHPLWGAAPDVGRCTRSEEVQCPRIGCSATFNKHFRGPAITPIISRRAHHHPPQALHPMWGSEPVIGRCTLYVALHPIWGAAPDQKRCNAHRSGAAPLSTSTFADAHYLPDPASAHLPPSPWTATHCGPNCHSLAVAIHGTFTGKLQT